MFSYDKNFSARINSFVDKFNNFNIYTKEKSKMNARAVIVFVMVAFFAVVSGFPALDDFLNEGLHIQVREEVQESEPLALEDTGSQDETGVRFRRATCDLLSVSVPWGSLNHSACAAHCLAKRKGFRGGRCKDGVCHCRR